jgi:PAS domain S-box-containing protein
MKLSITFKIAVFSTVAFLLLGIIGHIFYLRTIDQMKAGRSVAESQRILTEMKAIEGFLKDMEIAEQSYGLSGNSNYLDDLSSARQSLDQKLLVIESLADKDRSLIEQLPNLANTVKERVRLGADLVSVRKDQGFDAYEQAVRSGQLSTVIGELRQMLAKMQAQEERRLNFLDTGFAITSDTAIRDISSLIMLGFALLAAMFFVVMRHERVTREAGEIQRAIGLKFSGVFNQSSESIFLLDPDGKILQANEAGLRLVDAKLEDVVGLPYWETRWWRDSIQQQERLKQTVVQAAHGAIVRFESEYQAADGGLLSFDFSLKPLTDDEGNTVFLIAEGHELTDFKKAERAMQESESRLRAIFANMGEGLYQLDVAGKLIYLNPAGAKMLGYDMEEILGCDMHELIHRLWPDGTERKVCDCPILSVMKNGVPYASRDDFYSRRDGTFLPVRVLSSPLVIDGTVKGAVVCFEDITALKRAERRSTAQYSVTRALAQSDSMEEAASKIIESICVNIGWDVGAMWMYDEPAKSLRFVQMWHRQTINVNDFAEECRRKEGIDELSSHENAFSENAPLWISRTDRENNPYFPNAAAQCGMNTAFAFPIRNEETCIGVVELYSTEIQEPNLELLHMLDALGRQFGQFIERKRVERSLKESEELFRQLADNIKEVFWISTPNLERYLFISPAFEEVWGYSRSEVYDDPAIYMRVVVKEDRQKVADSIKLESLDGSGAGIEYRMYGANGEIRWIWSRVFPIKDEYGNVVRLCGIAHDITERKEVERRVSEFYSTVSHELRTPLTSIRASLGLIEGGLAGAITTRTAQLIQIARSESDRLIRLINDILDIRKIEAGRLELKREDILPADLVDITLSGVTAMAAEGGIKLVSEITVDEHLACDRDRVVQVLTNLVSNAIKFSPRDSTVTVSVERVEQQVRFTVLDLGHGIPDDQKPRLFGLFQQLDGSDSRPKGGTGLGLAISKAIVEEHGGQIGVDSMVGRGSRFWFELPCPTLKEMDTDTLDLARVHHILLVENDLQLTQLLRVLLAHDGYEVTVATSLSDADKALRRMRPEAIILDIQLPDGNGLDWFKRSKKSNAIANVPAVVLSGRSPDKQQDQEDPLLVDWLTKPFHEQELLKALRTAVERHGQNAGRPLVVNLQP